MEPKAVKLCNQTTSVDQYVTKFEWVLHNWSVLCNNSCSTDIESDSFELEGTKLNCQLIIDRKDKESNLRIAFSYHDSLIVGIKMYVKVNEMDTKLFDSVKPGSIVNLPLTLPKEIQKELDGEPNLESLNEHYDTLTILVQLVMTKYSDKKLIDNPTTNVLEKIKVMFDNKILCDQTFVLGDTEFLAHRAIVAAHSKVFETMFSTEMTEKEKNLVKIDDIDAKVFEQFLNYLYTGQVNNLKNSVEEMIVVADKYEVTELMTSCENCILNNLSENNVAKFLLLADKLHCDRLKTNALQFLKKNANTLMKLFKEGDPEVLRCLEEV